MNQPTHTATPYRVEQRPNATSDFRFVIMAEDGMPTIALVIQPGAGLRPGETPEQRAKANAEFIVKACNSYQRRADLLAELIEWAGQMGGWEAPCWDKVQAELEHDRQD